MSGRNEEEPRSDADASLEEDQRLLEINDRHEKGITIKIALISLYCRSRGSHTHTHTHILAERLLDTMQED